MKKYIHYGNTFFGRDFFMRIHNAEHMVKPSGGFWASPVDTGWGWAEWCRENDFDECSPDNSVTFALSDTANVLVIDNVAVLEKLPRCSPRFTSWVCLDFEKLLEQGVDAIEVLVSKDRGLYWELYGWDCDTLLVLNPDVVEGCD